jgi:phospholipid/cholesterol/gamma-HCH transport system permease protein
VSRLVRVMREKGDVRLDLETVGRLDTAGAYGLMRAAGAQFGDGRLSARPETARLLELVGNAMSSKRPPPRRVISLNEMMYRLGAGTVGVAREFVETMTFNGHLLAVTWRTILHPRRLRIAAAIGIAERAGLDAIPIVMVTNFFIGAVVGLLAAHSLKDFGLQSFAVEGVGVGILREFAIVITAVLLAGRSASAFAAEIGSMKMQQEIDAMRVLGIDPFEALVLPRFLALLVMTPLLTFIAAVAGLVGGGVALWGSIGLTPQFFMQRIVDNVGLTQFWIGLSKAPVMAIVIAAIGSRQGMEVGGDVESLGRRVTAAVVHAIFSIIFIDAVFALIYMELDI